MKNEKKKRNTILAKDYLLHKRVQDTPKSVEIPIRSPVLVNINTTNKVTLQNKDNYDNKENFTPLDFETLDNLSVDKKIPLPVSNIEKSLTELERFKKIVESQWTTELGSLALKYLNEKAAVKPKLLPVTEDIVKLKNFAEQSAEESYELLKSTKSIPAYKTLAETTLVLTILHNRKRVGDIQYLELNCYSEQINNNTNGTVQTEMATSLTENEKILTQHYKRIVSIGKGSRAITTRYLSSSKDLKILQLMEQGNAAQFKNKCLEEIDIDMENIEDVTQNNRNADVERREIENTDADDWIENNRTNTESTDATENNRTNTESTEATENNIYSNTHESNGESSDNGTYIPSIETSILEYI
ncbi:hypothetical protein MML48_4g00016860 [Holotrichia oblita]|uniref:Uncharacterized protein n=1 Tax=Holotrichia oblita TaxID=644536 RepID=A0ACB9T8U6_HOLOL|nr:hypothetical protein MML48_4g00016860 [Holotrichia oblita]